MCIYFYFSIDSFFDVDSKSTYYFLDLKTIKKNTQFKKKKTFILILFFEKSSFVLALHLYTRLMLLFVLFHSYYFDISIFLHEMTIVFNCNSLVATCLLHKFNDNYFVQALEIV